MVEVDSKKLSLEKMWQEISEKFLRQFSNSKLLLQICVLVPMMGFIKGDKYLNMHTWEITSRFQIKWSIPENLWIFSMLPNILSTKVQYILCLEHEKNNKWKTKTLLADLRNEWHFLAWCPTKTTFPWTRSAHLDWTESATINSYKQPEKNDSALLSPSL